MANTKSFHAPYHYHYKYIFDQYPGASRGVGQWSQLPGAPLAPARPVSPWGPDEPGGPEFCV